MSRAGSAAEHRLAMNLEVFEDSELVAYSAANCFVEGVYSAIQSSGRFVIALSGGSTPKRVYELLAGDEFRDRVDWTKTHIFFGDERCVPSNHPESNYRMVYETMLSRVPIPAKNIHPMQGEGEPAANAVAYEQELKAFFVNQQWPRFDLIFLGLGEDGHTASLFPGSAALHEKRAWVVANWVEKLKLFRLTLTAPAINHAAEIVFLVTGRGKAEALAAVVDGPEDPERWPAQLIRPVEGSLRWLVDKAAAASLQTVYLTSHITKEPKDDDENKYS